MHPEHSKNLQRANSPNPLLACASLGPTKRMDLQDSSMISLIRVYPEQCRSMNTNSVYASKSKNDLHVGSEVQHFTYTYLYIYIVRERDIDTTLHNTWAAFTSHRCMKKQDGTRKQEQ